MIIMEVKGLKRTINEYVKILQYREKTKICVGMPRSYIILSVAKIILFIFEIHIIIIVAITRISFSKIMFIHDVFFTSTRTVFFRDAVLVHKLCASA